ncbi:hypothetical protein OTU49_015347 [Cherax quadricarinatus]|uniref:Uncharacterized protein n=1 Tax=Cherax quadricarinatus TaxID=27406 RepID=A0AAW0XYC8_CHEQU
MANHIRGKKSSRHFRISQNSKGKDIPEKIKNERKSEHLDTVEKFEENDELTLELDIKRFRRNKESRHTSLEDNSCLQNSHSHGIQDPLTTQVIQEPLAIQGSQEPLAIQGSQEPLAIKGCQEPLAVQGSQEPLTIQIVDVLKLLNYMKDRFGELEVPLATLYLKATTMKNNKLDANKILEEEESFSLLEKLNKKLETLLENGNLTATQNIIFREIWVRFSDILLEIKSNKSPYMGLDTCRRAKLTMSEDVSESFTHKKHALTDQGCLNISHEKLTSMYLHAKNELRKDEYNKLTFEELHLPENDASMSVVSKSSTYIAPSPLYQSQYHQQSILSPFFAQKLSPPSNLYTAKHTDMHTVKPASFSLVSTDSVMGVVDEHQSSESKYLSPTRACLNTPSSRESSVVILQDLSPSKGNTVSPVISTVTNSEDVISDSYSMSGVSSSKLCQNVIKDCLLSFSPPHKDTKPSPENCINVDLEYPDYLSPTATSFLDINLSYASENCDVVHKLGTLPDKKRFNESELKLSDNVDKNTVGIKNSHVGKFKNPINITIPKKPIRITIPQLSKKDCFISSVNPVSDDQELM